MNFRQRIFPHLCFLFAAALAAFAASGRDLDALALMVQAERDFARLSVEKGVRESFVAFFAPNGNAFTPAPGNAKQFYGGLPAEKSSTTLDWQPVYSMMARAGDMGFNTGPYVASDDSAAHHPPRYGAFFSIWRKQADGSWKVELDIGTSTAAPPVNPEKWHAGEGSAYQPPAHLDAEAENRSLMRLESDFSAAAAKDVKAAYSRFMAEDVRYQRQGIFPLAGAKQVRQAVAANAAKGTLQMEALAVGMASSADLGYCYGKYSVTGTSKPVEHGFYTHVWRRDRNGAWRLVFDVATTVPGD